MALTTDELAAAMASHLEQVADDLVERWIDWLEEQVETRVIRALPRQAIRNHIPPVLRSIAQYTRSPLSGTRRQMLGHLELHATLRKSQGYDIGELLAEFDGLAHLVSAEFVRFLAAASDAAAPADTVEVFQRVSTGLRAAGFVTADVFRDAEVEDTARLSGRMEEFARTIAHEIRNPLHTIGLGLKSVRRPEVRTDAEAVEQHLTVMENALARAADLLDNIRQLALVESGRSRTDHLQRLQRLHQETLEELGPIARRHEVVVQQPGEIPDVSVDVLAFQLAFVNVVTNSVKYADLGKAERWVRIHYDVRHAASDANDLEVTITDNGLGIGEVYLRKVFQRNVRLHPEVADGTGLGLPITRQVLLERGGSISLDSEEGQGTTVVFRLPCFPGDVTVPTGSPRSASIVSRAVQRQVVDGAEVGEVDDELPPTGAPAGEE